jgi:hypothetical protein
VNIQTTRVDSSHGINLLPHQKAEDRKSQHEISGETSSPLVYDSIMYLDKIERSKQLPRNRVLHEQAWQ